MCRKAFSFAVTQIIGAQAEVLGFNRNPSWRWMSGRSQNRERGGRHSNLFGLLDRRIMTRSDALTHESCLWHLAYAALYKHEKREEEHTVYPEVLQLRQLFRKMHYDTFMRLLLYILVYFVVQPDWSLLLMCSVFLRLLKSILKNVTKKYSF